MFFKRNKDQENDCDVYQGKHRIKTQYFVKLDDGQYIMKDIYDGTVNQGTKEYWNYATPNLKEANQTQREYGGTIYEVVKDTCIRSYQGKQRKTGGHVLNHDESEIGDRPEAVIKKSKHVTFIPSNSNIKLPDEFLIDDVKYSKHVDKPHANADTATNIKLDTAELVKSINDLKEALCGTTDQPKIHELSKYEQPKGLYTNNHIDFYYIYINNPETVALLNKSNARLAIIEDDTNA